MFKKILGHKTYGSIGHLPNSRLGSADHSVNQGQADICCKKTRDKNDVVIVQEKLDGSCVGVALVDNILYPLSRAGWPAISSRYKQHRLFHNWVLTNEHRFRSVLQNGDRIVGEWLAQAHGTIYNLSGLEPFFAFDIMRGHYRFSFDEFSTRIEGIFQTPHLLHMGSSLSVEQAMKLHFVNKYPCDEPEGVIYRVERNSCVDFLAKWVRPEKIDGKHLPEISKGEEIWNWQPSNTHSSTN